MVHKTNSFFPNGAPYTMPALSCASVDTGENTQSQVREIVAEPNSSVTPHHSDVTASPRNEDETASLTQSTSGCSEMETTQLSSTIIRDGEVLSPHVLSSAAAKSALDASTPSLSHQSASNLTLPQEPFQPRFFDFPLKVYGNRQRSFFQHGLIRLNGCNILLRVHQIFTISSPVMYVIKL